MDCEGGAWDYKPRPKKKAPVAPSEAGTSCPNGITACPNPSTSTNLNEQLLESDAVKSTNATPNHVSILDADETDKKGLVISILALALSIPALIGAWCWPALVIGIVSGTVSASARTLGHTISLYVTGGLMLLVGGVIAREAFFGPRSYAPSFKTRFGPLCVMVVAAILIMCEPTRHVINDANIWPWCGNNPQYDRINSTDPFPEQCMWSATQYVCTEVCCVSTWQPTAADPAEYSWLPPTADFFPDGPLPGPFATLNPDESVYLPKGVKPAPGMPLFEASTAAPLTFFETGDFNPMRASSPQTGCKFGVNAATGYCFLTNQSLSYEAQLEQLYNYSSASKTAAFNATTFGGCACDDCVPHENWFHLSVVGTISSLLCTYIGFILLAVAVGWNANIIKKLAKIGDQWRQLRGR